MCKLQLQCAPQHACLADKPRVRHTQFFTSCSINALQHPSLSGSQQRGAAAERHRVPGKLSMLYLQWSHTHALAVPCSMPAFQRASGEVLLQKYKDYLARLMENAVMFETCLQASCWAVHRHCFLTLSAAPLWWLVRLARRQPVLQMFIRTAALCITLSELVWVSGVHAGTLLPC